MFLWDFYVTLKKIKVSFDSHKSISPAAHRVLYYKTLRHPYPPWKILPNATWNFPSTVIVTSFTHCSYERKCYHLQIFSTRVWRSAETFKRPFSQNDQSMKILQLIKKVRDKSGRKKQKAKYTLVILIQSSLFFKIREMSRGYTNTR